MGATQVGAGIVGMGSGAVTGACSTSELPRRALHTAERALAAPRARDGRYPLARAPEQATRALLLSLGEFPSVTTVTHARPAGAKRNGTRSHGLSSFDRSLGMSTTGGMRRDPLMLTVSIESQ